MKSIYISCKPKTSEWVRTFPLNLFEAVLQGTQVSHVQTRTIGLLNFQTTKDFKFGNLNYGADFRKK